MSLPTSGSSYWQPTRELMTKNVTTRTGTRSTRKDSMGVPLAAILAVSAGCVLAFQAPLNAYLARHSTVVVAGFVSFAVGTVLLALLVVVSGQASQLGKLAHVPPLYFAGGPCGLVFVVTALATVRPLGASGVVATSLLGQLIASVVIDRLGLFGLARAAISPVRVAGLLLIAGGTAMVLITHRG